VRGQPAIDEQMTAHRPDRARLAVHERLTATARQVQRSSPGGRLRRTQERCRSPVLSSGCSSAGPSISMTANTGTSAGIRRSDAEIAGITLASPMSRCQSASGDGV
jgi:hypothetical protein